jgi:undecaprenyl pyrophosphate phosphatase UppP
MAHFNVRPAAHVVTGISFAFLLAQLPWLGYCYLGLGGESPNNNLAGFAWTVVASVGAFVLSLIGVAFGLMGTKHHTAGKVALALNALACLAAVGVFLASFIAAG